MWQMYTTYSAIHTHTHPHMSFISFASSFRSTFASLIVNGQVQSVDVCASECRCGCGCVCGCGICIFARSKRSKNCPANQLVNLCVMESFTHISLSLSQFSGPLSFSSLSRLFLSGSFCPPLPRCVTATVVIVRLCVWYTGTKSEIEREKVDASSRKASGAGEFVH